MKSFIVLFLAGFITNCASGPDSLNPFKSASSQLSSLDEDLPCDSRCLQSCEDIFRDTEDFNACILLSPPQVNLVKKAERKMRNGKWSSIEEKEVEALTDISHRLWIRFASTRQSSAEEMLVWIAEENGIADYLDSKGEVLKSGLLALSSPLKGDKGVKAGLITDIQDGKTFLEWAAWEENFPAFSKIHQLILDACGNEPICIERIYCDQSSDIVINTINEMDLTGDIVSGKSRFNRSYCS